MTGINNIGSNNLIKIQMDKMNKVPQEQPVQQNSNQSKSGLINSYLENQARINQPVVDATQKVSDIGSKPVNSAT